MSEWIRVEDGKPPLEKRVLLLVESMDVVTGWLRKIGEDDIYFCFGNEYVSWDFEFNFDVGAVTHWMPLPEPPKN